MDEKIEKENIIKKDNLTRKIIVIITAIILTLIIILTSISKSYFQTSNFINSFYKFSLLSQDKTGINITENLIIIYDGYEEIYIDSIINNYKQQGFIENNNILTYQNTQIKIKSYNKQLLDKKYTLIKIEVGEISEN